MRLRPLQLSLTLQLTLLLVGSALLAVLVFGVFTATQLRRGFSEYLRAQDEARLDAFATLVQQVIEREGLDALRERPELLGQSLGQALPRPDPRDGFWRAPAPRRPHAGEGGRGGGNRGLNPNGPRGFVVVDLEGRPLWGRPPPPGAAPPVERGLERDGRQVALARFYPRAEDPEAQDERDRRFLRSQLQGLLIVGAVLALLAAACAVLVARRWSAPLRAAQAATHRLAQGDFAHRLTGSPGWVRDETDALAADLNRLAESLQRLDGSRRRWIAELSHELRTPLTVLRGEIDAVLDGVRTLGPERLLALQAEVSRLTRLADDFALLARSDVQALPVHPRAVAPADLLQAAAQRWHTPLHSAGLHLSLQLDPAALARQSLDPERCAQILDNLLANALAYTAAPGQVQLLQQGWSWIVDDSPPGVSDPAERERLFEPLYRADPARQRREGGSGLGLSIARALVQAQGGSIRADASPLGGLRIVIDWKAA